MDNLYIVRSPLQIINCLEAIEYFNLENNILVVIYNNTDNTNSQMDKIASMYNWKNVIRVNKEKKKSKMLDYVKLIKQLKKNTYNYVFFSNYGSVQRIILSNLKMNNLFFIDDGVETLNRYESVFVKNKINRFRLKLARFWLLGLKTKIKKTINFFTYFDLKPFGKSKVIINNLEHFSKKYLSSNDIDNKIYILGQPLVTVQLLKEDHYFEYLDFLIKNTSDDIIYIPHRTEIISDRLKSYEGGKFEIRDINMPVELYFLENKVYPYHIISFLTTAFFTLKKFYNITRFSYIYIPQDRILRKNDAEKVYNSLRKLGINEMSLDTKMNENKNKPL